MNIVSFSFSYLDGLSFSNALQSTFSWLMYTYNISWIYVSFYWFQHKAGFSSISFEWGFTFPYCYRLVSLQHYTKLGHRFILIHCYIFKPNEPLYTYGSRYCLGCWLVIIYIVEITRSATWRLFFTAFMKLDLN